MSRITAWIKRRFFPAPPQAVAAAPAAAAEPQVEAKAAAPDAEADAAPAEDELPMMEAEDAPPSEDGSVSRLTKAALGVASVILLLVIFRRTSPALFKSLVMSLRGL